MNNKGEVLRKKASLVWKGYSQQEGKDYEETFFPIARIEAVRMFLPYIENKKFKVY